MEDYNNGTLPFQEFFELWLEMKGLSQKEVALLIGVSQSTISTWKARSTPSVRDLEKIGAAFPEDADKFVAAIARTLRYHVRAETRARRDRKTAGSSPDE